LEARLENPAQEVKRLKRCVNDVVSLVALPAMWAGSEPSQIVRTLVDVLLGVLGLDLVYALLKGTNGEPLIETVRVSSVWEVPPQREEIGAVLHKWLGDNPQEWPTVVRKPFRERDISIVPLRLGLQYEFGLIVAGSQRIDFPQQTEGLILNLAANQAAIGLQEARILSEQKKIAHELERQVAERTACITAANEDLRKEIAERKEAEGKLRRSEADLLEAQRLTQTCSWKHDIPSGRVSFSPEALRMFGANADEDTSDPRCWFGKIHPEDLRRTQSLFEQCETEKTSYEADYRVVLPDGSIRYQHSVGRPVLSGSGELVEFIGTAVDVTEQVQARAALQKAFDEIEKSEAKLRQVIDTIPTLAWCNLPDGPNEFLNKGWHEYTGLSPEESHGWGWQVAFHPDDLPPLMKRWREMLVSGEPGEIEARLRRYDGAYRWFLIRAQPLRDEVGKIVRWYGTSTDIDDRKRAEEQLGRSEAFLAEGQRLSLTGSFSWKVATDEITWSEQLYRIFEFDERLPVTIERIGSRVHPDDLPLLQDMIERARHAASDFEYQHRLLMPDQSVKHVHLFAHATQDKYGRLEYVGAAQDVTDLRTIIDAIANPIVVLGLDGKTLYANQVALDQSGLTPAEVKNKGFFPQACHSDDLARAREERDVGLSKGVPFELEMRLLKNGVYRWHLIQLNPLKNERGHIIRWYATATDIDDRKKTEERLRNENLVLREEIDRSSMFEEIVGSCKPMREVLKQVEKVAPSDSTVLILGETGTGKELIARALHRRSKRTTRAFVRVNCAAIPQSLIASELFGHEKGAFTGALQRRVGRFEAADGGTLFLDEIGDLPMETQIALLRVLQEKEFERVGSNHPISVDVRLIAATNRDLPAAVVVGTFRQDLFYRLNVFPIAVPPLRERAEDIPLLVEYFVGRFAKGVGKNIRHISKATLEQLKGYHWPGNIRELQNVVERAVILSETDTFVVDESWLKRESADPSPHEGLSALVDREAEMIETALAESHGRISGPSGAAAKLGIPRQTLESKIRRLGIDKYGQK
jgi:formate hydrogenlyase transcriptional activator